MGDSKLWMIFVIIVLTLLSGFFDSQGFVFASKIWVGNKIIWSEVLKSGLGYTGGIILYWLTIKYLNQFGIVSPEIQTLGWFSVTLIGIALTSGDFFSWSLGDKTIGILVFLGIGWLMFRSGG